MAEQKDARGHDRPQRKIVTYWITPFILSCCCFVLILLFSCTEYMKIAELRLYDARVRMKKADKTHYADRRITLIALDEASDREIKEPILMWIPKFTKVIGKLNEAGAQVIGFDYLIKKSPDDLIEYGLDAVFERKGTPLSEQKKIRASLASDTPFNGEFGQAIERTKSVLASTFDENEGTYLFPGEDILLFAGENNLGTAMIEHDIDGVVRQATSHWTVKGKSYISFPFLIAARVMGKEKELREGSLFSSISFYRGSNILINYCPPLTWTGFETHSFTAIYDMVAKNDMAQLKRMFAGKIVLVGPTGKDSQDLKLTPFDYKPVIPGVEIQGYIINTIIHGDYLTHISPAIDSAILFALVIFYFFAAFRLRLYLGILTGVLMGILYSLAAINFFNAGNLWMSLATPLLSIPLVLLFSSVYRYLVVEKEKQWLVKELSRFVSEMEERVFQLLIELGAQFVGAEEGSLLMLDGDKKELVLAATHGEHTSKDMKIGERIPLGKGTIGLAAQTHEVQLAAPTIKEGEPGDAGEQGKEPCATLAAPILKDDTLIGVITAASFKKGKRFAVADALLYGRLATVFAIVIDQNRRLSMQNSRGDKDELLQPLSENEKYQEKIIKTVTEMINSKPDKLEKIAKLVSSIREMI
jgi:CHASE2 domain-containing sensor protein